MDLEKLKKYNARLDRYLTKYSKVKRDLFDIVKRVEIEEAKPYLKRYLLTPKSWYLDREDYLCNLMIWIEKRIPYVTNKIYENGK